MSTSWVRRSVLRLISCTGVSYGLCRAIRRQRRSSTRTGRGPRSEEHTSELQSHVNLVCRLLLEKKKGLIRFSCLGGTTSYELPRVLATVRYYVVLTAF